MENLCRVHINWNNFCSNIRLLRQSHHALMPVIKAEAYGHGTERAAAELEKLGITWAAAGTIEEAALVRSSGFSGRIVALLTHFNSGEDAAFCIRHKILPLIHCWQDLILASDALKAADAELDIAFKVETGMGRLGFRLEDVAEAAQFMVSSKKLRPVLQLSHFAVADEPGQDAYTEQQADVFWQAAAIMHEYFPAMRCSLSNTAGLLRQSSGRNEICRPGLALYGYDPLYGTEFEGGGSKLLPVMEVTAPLVSVHCLRKGESLGYGLAYRAESDRIVGWAAIGYADGYRRNPGAGACMCARGVRVPVIGRVAMQMTCLDLTDLPETPAVGEQVYVMGGPGNAVSAQDIASWWGTIPYEVTCLLGKNTQVI